MKDILVTEYAFVGILINNNIIYNVVENEGDFDNTGISIINYLQKDKCGYISEFFNSQKYNGIKFIFDNKFIYDSKPVNNSLNIENFNKLESLILKEYNNIFIYDMYNDLLIIKNKNKLVALDYTNNLDINQMRDAI